ncbi:MAG: hypothetical protein HYV07_19660 [Deltaproteobacteria bacterium]|nr:hypothetical protein [Deltaproteobacteria bacterium]
MRSDLLVAVMLAGCSDAGGGSSIDVATLGDFDFAWAIPLDPDGVPAKPVRLSSVLDRVSVDSDGALVFVALGREDLLGTGSQQLDESRHDQVRLEHDSSLVDECAEVGELDAGARELRRALPDGARILHLTEPFDGVPSPTPRSNHDFLEELVLRIPVARRSCASAIAADFSAFGARERPLSDFPDFRGRDPESNGPDVLRRLAFVGPDRILAWGPGVWVVDRSGELVDEPARHLVPSLDCPDGGDSNLVWDVDIQARPDGSFDLTAVGAGFWSMSLSASGELRCLSTFPIPHVVYAIRHDRAGRVLAVGDFGLVVVGEPARGFTSSSFPEGTPEGELEELYSMASIEDGARFAIGTGENRIHRVDAETRSGSVFAMPSIRPQGDTVHSLTELSAPGELFVSMRYSGAYRVLGTVPELVGVDLSAADTTCAVRRSCGRSIFEGTFDAVRRVGPRNHVLALPRHCPMLVELDLEAGCTAPFEDGMGSDVAAEFFGMTVSSTEVAVSGAGGMIMVAPLRE